MVLNEITMAANGETTITSYVIPYAVSMDKLFEMYIRAYLKKAGVKSFDSQEDGVRLARYDDKTPVLKGRNGGYANYISGNVKPDIIIQNPVTGKHVIFDVKYKNSANARFSRSDRLQVLAYGLMFGSEDVGIIFPALDGAKNTYYKCNEINSNESRTRFYHQFEISIDRDTSSTMTAKTGGEEISVMDYLNRLLK